MQIVHFPLPSVALKRLCVRELKNPIFLKAKALSKYALKRKRNRKETKRSRKKDENRKKSRNNEYSLSCMQLRQSEMKTSKSVGGIMCSGRTFPFRFLAEYGRL